MSPIISIIEFRDEDEKLSNTDVFFGNVYDIINVLTESYSIKGNRVAYLTKYLLKVLNNDKLIDANKNLINLPSIYQKNPPFEWNTRNVCEISESLNGTIEKLNIITKINREKGVFRFTNESYDRIAIEFDINTTHLNIKNR